MEKQEYLNLKNYKERNDNYCKWQYLEFKECDELLNYIHKIKPVLIGKSIDKILFSPDYCDFDDLNLDLEKDNENVSLDSGCPTIFEIEKHKLTLNMYSGSCLQISLDRELIVKDKKAMPYYDVSNLFSKNIIGKKIINFKLENISKYDAEASLDWYPDSILSENMFKSLIIELDNGFCLKNSICYDNSSISERKLENI